MAAVDGNSYWWDRWAGRPRFRWRGKRRNDAQGREGSWRLNAFMIVPPRRKRQTGWFRVAWGPGSCSSGKLQVGQIGTQQQPLRLCGAEGACGIDWSGFVWSGVVGMYVAVRPRGCVVWDVGCRGTQGPELGSYLLQCWRLGIWHVERAKRRKKAETLFMRKECTKRTRNLLLRRACRCNKTHARAAQYVRCSVQYVTREKGGRESKPSKTVRWGVAWKIRETREVV